MNTDQSRFIHRKTENQKKNDREGEPGHFTEKGEYGLGYTGVTFIITLCTIDAISLRKV